MIQRPPITVDASGDYSRRYLAFCRANDHDKDDHREAWMVQFGSWLDDHFKMWCEENRTTPERIDYEAFDAWIEALNP